MNILAHLVLSGDSPEIRFGNFIGDAVKGRAYMDWEQPYRAGLQLHRFIDSYIDEHPAALEIRRDLAKDLGLYAPVALDVLFDHTLSICWSEFYSFSREEFIQQCYREIHIREAMIPPKMLEFSRAMISYDWLNAYHSEQGIERALEGMSRRVKGQPQLSLALRYFQNERKKVLSRFRKFYPDMKEQCAKKRAEFLGRIE